MTGVRSMMETMRVAVALMLLLVVGGSVFAWRHFDAKGERKQERQNATFERDVAEMEFFQKAPVDVTAKQLVRLWETNEMAARQQYSGRPIAIDGHVDRVVVENVDGRDLPVLAFAEGGLCVFNRGEVQPELAQLRRGQHVIVIGQSRGIRTAGTHLTTHCRLEAWSERD